MSESSANIDRHDVCARPSWVVFDAVGTLLTPSPTVAEAYWAVGNRFGSRYAVDDVSRRFRSAFAASDADGFVGNRRGATSEAEELARWRWIVQQVFDDVTDQDRCFGLLWDHFAQPAHWRVYDEVPEVLAAVSAAGVRLAIASNFDCRLHQVLAGHPVLASIERVFVSSELGSRKPSADFYRAVQSALNVPAVQLLMLGDDWDCDVVGPRHSGWQSMLIERRLSASGPDRWSSLQPLREWLAP
jgi:putative hydrolase of the HAD superfamily